MQTSPYTRLNHLFSSRTVKTHALVKLKLRFQTLAFMSFHINLALTIQSLAPIQKEYFAGFTQNLSFTIS